MAWFPRLTDLFDRLATYPLWVVGLEIALIGLAVWGILRAVQGTRTAGLLKGLLVVVVAAAVVSRIVGGGETFQRLSYLYDRVVALVAITLLIIFQPELRRALLRIGEAPFFRSTPKDIQFIVEEITEAAAFLGKARFGGLVVIERQSSLSGLSEGGVVLNAELSAALLKTIFYPGSALHDLAAVVKGKQIHSASVQLPLAEPGDLPDPTFGSRHRAAVGLTKECDALVVVISEETGKIRIAERGRLSSPLTADELRRELTKRLEASRLLGAVARGGQGAPAEPPVDLSLGHGPSLEPMNPDAPLAPESYYDMDAQHGRGRRD